MFVGIPTYNRFELCAKAIDAFNAGSLKPTMILVVDNSGNSGFINYIRANNLIWDNVSVFVSPVNLGCSRAWNFMLREFAKTDPTQHVLISNDDIEVYPDCLELFDKASQERPGSPMYCAGGIASPNAFSLFMTRLDKLEVTSGLFDETFLYPYCEDGDMARRLWLVGYELDRVEGASAQHVGSATIAGYEPHEKELHHTRFARNSTYFYLKWNVNHERIYDSKGYIEPFNGSEQDRELAMSYLRATFGE